LQQLQQYNQVFGNPSNTTQMASITTWGRRSPRPTATPCREPPTSTVNSPP
jgi:hypothetical protein